MLQPNFTLFKDLLPYDKFYIDTNHGRVSFIKLGNKGKVLDSEHYLFDKGSFKKFNDNTVINKA